MRNKLKALLGLDKSIAERLTHTPPQQEQRAQSQAGGMPHVLHSDNCTSCELRLDYVNGDQHAVRRGCDVHCGLTREERGPATTGRA